MFLEILLFALLAIGIGAAFTFFGYSLFRIIFPIWGFLVGFWMGGTAIAGLFGGSFLGTTLGVIGGFTLGLLFGFLAYYLYAFMVILFGISIGFALGQGLILLLGINQGFLSWSFGIMGAFVFGIIFFSLRLPRILLMVLTAFAGSAAVIAGVLALFGQVPPSQLGMVMTRITIQTSWFWWIIWFGLGAVGILGQYAMAEAVEFPDKYTYDSTMAESGTKKP